MKRSCDFASEQQEVRRRAAFDMRGISLRDVPVSRSSSVPPRGRFSVFRVYRRRNLRHQRVDWTYRGQPDGDAARCGQDNWVEADTHPCAALGAGRPNGAHTRPGARRTRAAPGAGRLNGAHTHGPPRDGPPLFFLNNLRSVNTERAEARGHGGGWGEDVVPIAQLISIPQMRNENSMRNKLNILNAVWGLPSMRSSRVGSSRST